jgi:hypothetical protein
MNETKLKNRFKVALKRASMGDITGQDLKAIVEFQLREYIMEGEEPFNELELALLTQQMVLFN